MEKPGRYYITFGFKYTGDEATGAVHPMGMLGSGYALIEALDLDMAREIAFAIFGDEYAFVYDEDDFIGEGIMRRHYADQEGPLLYIGWSSPLETP